MAGIIRRVTPDPVADEARLAAFRDALPAVGAGIYLDPGTAGPLPAETAAAMAEFAAFELRTGRSHLDFSGEVLARLDEARAAVAALLTTDIDRIALTTSISAAMGIAAWSVDWRPGDRAVTTTTEPAGSLGPLDAVRDRLGVELVGVDVDQAGDEAAALAAFDAAIGPRTRFVSISHVSGATGVRLPIEAVARIAHDRGAVVAVDGAQAAGAIPLDVPAIGADFYALPSQKWLLGPDGVAALWVAPGQDPGSSRAMRLDLEAWYKPAVVGFARSVGWLTMFVGLDWLYGRAATMARVAHARLGGIAGVEVLTPADRLATTIVFRIAGWSAATALEELGARVFAIAGVVPPHDAIRIGTGAWITEAEVDRFAGAVELLAAHTPDTMPARRTLTIVDERLR
jgi:L-cysteine/cystine lyase